MNHPGAPELAREDEFGPWTEMRGLIQHHLDIDGALVDAGPVIAERLLSGVDVVDVFDALHGDVGEACDERHFVGEKPAQVVEVDPPVVAGFFVLWVPVRPEH